MLSSTSPWKVAQLTDERYKMYVSNLNSFGLFEKYPQNLRVLLVILLLIMVVWDDAARPFETDEC
jgi:hypothetical protein